MALATTEVYVVARIASEGYGLAMVGVIGVASGSGCLSAMWIHKRFIKK